MKDHKRTKDNVKSYLEIKKYKNAGKFAECVPFPRERFEQIFDYRISRRYGFFPENNIREEIDYESGARIIHVSPSQLPSGFGWRALGMYDPNTHTIYLSNDLPYYQYRFVRQHEIGHALGIKDEAKADQFAASRVGYNLESRVQKIAA